MDSSGLIAPVPITPGHALAPAIRAALKASEHAARAEVDRLPTNALREEYFSEVATWCQRNIANLQGQQAGASRSQAG